MITDQEIRVAQALGRAKVAYSALSGVRDLVKDPKLAEFAKTACAAANNLECEILKALANSKREG